MCMSFTITTLATLIQSTVLLFQILTSAALPLLSATSMPTVKIMSDLIHVHVKQDTMVMGKRVLVRWWAIILK